MTKVPVPYITEVLIFLFAAITIAPLFKKMKLSPVLGYLVAGSIIGPFALGFVDDIERVQNVAELGVIFLLFMIGLELPMERLRTMRKLVFGLGLAQVLCTMMVIAGFCMAIGFPLEQAMVIGGALSLSSTALVIQLLSERHELALKHGRATFSVLLFQDLAVVPILTMVLILGNDGGESSIGIVILSALGKALLAIVSVILFGRYALRPLYRYFSSIQNPEIFTAATLLIVLGISAATGYMGLSMALGAFLAGMLIAETEYRHQVETDIKPFQGLLLGLFFMAVGMSINYNLVVQNIGQLAQILLGLMLLKALIVFGLAKAYSLSTVCAMRTAVFLAQGGEFAFVIFKVAAGNGVLPNDISQIILVAVAVSMALTPVFIDIVGRLIQPNSTPKEDSLALDKLAAQTHDSHSHVLIAGFGRVGKTIASMLEKQGIPYIAIDTDSKVVSQAHEQGLPVYLGDASKLELLEAVGTDRATTAVITLDATKTCRRVLHTLRAHFPHVKVLARARDIKESKELLEEGCVATVPETLSASIQLGKAVLEIAGHAAPIDEKPA